MKLSNILKTSCKRFSVKFLEVNSFLRNYLQYFAKGIPENQDPGPWWDPSGVLQKPENRDPSGTL